MIELSQETEALARRMADARRVTVDTAVRQALEASAHAAGALPERVRPREQSPEAVVLRRDRMERIVREIAALPVIDKRSPSEIMDDLNAP
jgi:antitoxin VapB